MKKPLQIVSVLVLMSGGVLSGCDSGNDEPAAGSDETVVTTPERAPADTVDSGAAQRAVISDRLPYAEVNDELVYGYFVFPSDMVEPLPAVIMIHEWWGLNDTVRQMADRLAAEGYIVLAVDLFGGATAETAVDARKLMVAIVEDPDPASENIRQAYSFVSTTAGAPSVGALGWSFGGGWALNAALLFPDDLDASVIYYGQVIDDEERLQPVNTPLLGLFGEADRGIQVESVRAFEAALERLRKNFEIHVYPDIRHNFANPTSTYYDAAAAEDAWGKTVEFLRRHLATSDQGA